jgi:hypothetical protein
MATEKAPRRRKVTGARRRRAKPPVTIDIEAEATAPEAEGSTGGDPTVAGATVSASAEVSSSKPEIGESSPEATDMAPVKEPAAGAVVDTGQGRTLSQIFTHLGAGAAGGLIVLALGFGLQATGVIPAPGQADVALALADSDRLGKTLSALDQRVMLIEAASAQTIADRALLDDIARQVGVVDAFGSSLGDRLLNIEASVASLGESPGDNGEAVTGQLLEDLTARIERLESAPSVPVEDGAAATLETPSDNIDSQAKDVATLTPESDAPSDAIATDASNADRAKLQKLSALVEKGVASRAVLTADFTAVADAIVAALREPDGDAGFFDKMLSYGGDLVKVTPIEALPGDDPMAVVSRMRIAVDSGDLAAALAAREALPLPGQAASQEWAEAAGDRLEIESLLDEIAKASKTGAGSGQAASQ